MVLICKEKEECIHVKQNKGLSKLVFAKILIIYTILIPNYAMTLSK